MSNPCAFRGCNRHVPARVNSAYCYRHLNQLNKIGEAMSHQCSVKGCETSISMDSAICDHHHALLTAKANNDLGICATKGCGNTMNTDTGYCNNPMHDAQTDEW